VNALGSIKNSNTPTLLLNLSSILTIQNCDILTAADRKLVSSDKAEERTAIPAASELANDLMPINRLSLWKNLEYDGEWSLV